MDLQPQRSDPVLPAPMPCLGGGLPALLQHMHPAVPAVLPVAPTSSTARGAAAAVVLVLNLPLLPDQHQHPQLLHLVQLLADVTAETD